MNTTPVRTKQHDRFCDLHGECAEIDTDIPTPHMWQEDREEVYCTQCFNACACSYIDRIRKSEADNVLRRIVKLHSVTFMSTGDPRCTACKHIYPCPTVSAAVGSDD